MRIALLGTRGVPASYSGFETCVEQMGKRLAERGHDVTVYCRAHHVKYTNSTYIGMHLIKKRTIPNKYLDTIVHTFLCSIHALRQRFDVAVYFIAGNSPVSWIPRIVGTKTVLNVDGLDWKREKWPALAKLYIQLAEYLATKLPNTYVTDSCIVQRYYEQRFGSRAVYIPYGSEIEILPPGETLSKYKLEARKYFLFVGRLVPENCAHHLISAYRQVSTDYQCVIVGDSSYSEDYKRRLRELAGNDPRIIFTGYVFGDGYKELGSNAFAFVETSGVGGTHPALLEAMAFANCVIVHGTEENLESIGDAGLSYDGKLGAESLKNMLELTIANPQLVKEYRKKAQARAQATYSWESIVNAYESLFYSLLKMPFPERLRPGLPCGLEKSDPS